MTFYTNLAARALALLTKFGQDVILRRTTVGAYDDSIAQTVNTTQDLTFKGAVFSFKDGTTFVRNIAVQSTDKKLLLESTAVPKIDDSILIGGVEYAILSLMEINPAGTPVLYELHLRH